MTISVTDATKSYTGDGATVAFPTVFVFGTSADIEVVERIIATGAETTKTLTTHYTVSGGGGAGAVPANGTVTAVAAPASTVTWTLRRIITEDQGTALPTAGALPSASIENMVDRAIMMVQQHTEELGRSLVFPKTDSSTLDPTIPSSVDRASKFLKFSATGEPEAAVSTFTGMDDGTALAPSLYFADDVDTGFFRFGNNTLSFASGGVESMRFDDKAIYLVDGEVGIPSLRFLNDVDTGMFRPGDNRLGLASGGAIALEITAGQDVVIGNGSAIPTTSTSGFLMIPGCAGAPTGDPSSDGPGAVALVYDTTNNALYANDGSGWLGVSLT